jgi:LPXTG-site transpeptidase (sortase) family protein
MDAPPPDKKKYIKGLRILVTVLIVVVIVLILKIVLPSLDGIYLPEPLPLDRASLTTAEGAVVPQRIIIPRLGIGADAEHVGRTAGGNMAVPVEFENVGWFREGYIPGETGNAVIAGHVDDARGNRAVFGRLSDVELGDSVLVEGEEGMLEFRVVRKEIFPYDTEDTSEIFGESDKPMLNLITCDGTWDQSRRTYTERLVVFAELVLPEGDNKESVSADD